MGCRRNRASCATSRARPTRQYTLGNERLRQRGLRGTVATDDFDLWRHEGTNTFAKLMAAKSVDQAIEMQTEFGQRAYDAHLKQMTKLVNMYAELAKVSARTKR
jgi:hypothetical protein